MSPVITMLVMLVAGMVIAMTTGEGGFFVCFAVLAPLMAVMAKRSEDRKVQKQQTELLRQIAMQNQEKVKHG
jgi:hypothetical protein